MSDKSITVLDGKRDRRGLLALIGGGGAAALAALFSRSDGAQATHGGGVDPDALHVGQFNQGAAQTALQANLSPSGFGPFALHISNPSGEAGAFFGGDGNRAVFGASDGVAIQGASQGVDPGASGVSGITFGAGSGVNGVSFAGSPPDVVPGSGTGVSGSSGSGPGISGSSGSGPGVNGESDSGPGVFGGSGSGVGGHFMSESGAALLVEGPARFSTAGAATVPAGQNSVFVANPAVTANSHISATLASNPGNRVLKWVARNPGSGFTVHLLPGPGAKPATDLTYLIVEPA